jgi:hypothetical protein
MIPNINKNATLSTMILTIMTIYTKCCYAESRYLFNVSNAKCCYAKCLYDECRGAKIFSPKKIYNFASV